MEEGTSPATATRRQTRASVIVHLHCRRRRSASSMKLTRDEPRLKELMKYAVPVVLALLMLRHQREPEALFRKNPAPLWSFIAATAVYWLIAEAMTSYRRRRQQLILRRGAVAFGVLSALSLASMFLPHPFSLLPLLTWMLAALLSAFAWIRTPLLNSFDKVRGMVVRNRGVAWIRTPLANLFDKVRGMVVRNRGVDPETDLPTLPVSLHTT